MTVLFHRLEPMPPAHPRAWFPTLPVLGGAGRSAGKLSPRSRFLDDDAVYTTSGKASTFWALKDAGVRAGDEVLVPAYHCPTMVHPILAIGAVPVFLPIEPDLGISLRSVKESSTSATRALLLPHFFGALQSQISEISRWCRERAIVLVEDCAHAFYGGPEGELPGSWGDYAIASTRKFFPGSEGGVIAANGHRFSQRLTAAGWGDELRGVVGISHDVLRYRLFTVERMRWRDGSTASLVGPATESDSIAEAAATPALPEELNAAVIGRQALKSAVWLIRHADHARIASVRRRRYQVWADALAGLRDVVPFHGPLPAERVPYVFPLRLLRPGAQFRALKYGGIAVWRWDQLAVSRCQVSARLALELIQLPCQHTMPDRDFDVLVAQTRQVLTAV